MFQVNKSSSDFWNSLKLTWQQCADLPYKCWAFCVVELDGKLYASMLHSGGGYVTPVMYDSNKDQWSFLPELPCGHFSLVAVHDWKQLLAIGGSINNDGVIGVAAEVTNKVFLWEEENIRWTTPYPNMPTARCHCSSISHGSAVIVAGGVTSWNPFTMTRAVEVLHIREHSLFTKSQWSVVEQLPHVVSEAIPLIVNDKLYIAVGHDTKGPSTCNVISASIPELLQSSNKKTSSNKKPSSSQVWNRLPDMPYSSSSINHYQGRLISFGGDYGVEQPDKDKPVWQSVPLIHIYNPDTRTWDCVGEIPHGYLLGRSAHISENKFLFIGGLSGTYNPGKDDDMIKTCSILTLSPQ